MVILRPDMICAGTSFCFTGTIFLGQVPSSAAQALDSVAEAHYSCAEAPYSGAEAPCSAAEALSSAAQAPYSAHRASQQSLQALLELGLHIWFNIRVYP